jgi:hypothetical protein
MPPAEFRVSGGVAPDTARRASRTTPFRPFRRHSSCGLLRGRRPGHRHHGPFTSVAVASLRMARSSSAMRFHRVASRRAWKLAMHRGSAYARPARQATRENRRQRVARRYAIGGGEVAIASGPVSARSRSWATIVELRLSSISQLSAPGAGRRAPAPAAMQDVVGLPCQLRFFSDAAWVPFCPSVAPLRPDTAGRSVTATLGGSGA